MRKILLTLITLFFMSAPIYGQSPKSAATPPPANSTAATAPTAPKPEPVKLKDDEQAQFDQTFEKLKELGPQVESAKQAAESAIANFNAANATLRELQATRAALYYKALAERGLKPDEYELTATGISKKVKPAEPVAEKK